MVAVLLAGQAGGQTLARKNWAGSGMSAQVWWGRAVFCRMDPGASLKQAAGTLDRMQAMGCDAVMLGALGSGAGTPVDLRFGTLDDADALIEGAVHRKTRVVMDLPIASAPEAEITGRMRFWLTRGVAGFVLVGTPPDAGLVHRLRQVAAGVVGTRVLIGESASADVQLVVKHVGGGFAGLRERLAGAGAGALLEGAAGSERVSAAMLLENGGAAGVPVHAGPEPVKAAREFTADELMLWVPKGDPSLRKVEEAHEAALAAWYGSLAELHRGNEALRTGQATYLNHDAQGVLTWVVRGKVGVAPVLVVVNLSGKAVKVSVGPEVKALGVRGGYLRTLLKAEALGSGMATLDSIELGADGVLVGEIH